jgi:hypothetical protein
MALEPSIALGVKPLEIANPLNQFAQVAQLQNYQRQNELANRALEQEDALNRAYAMSINKDTGQIDPNKLRQSMANAGIASKLPAAEQSIMQGRKLATEVGKGELELRLAKADQAVKDIARFNTRDEILADLKRNMDAGNLDPAKAEQIAASVPQDPAKIPAWQLQTMRGILSAKDQLEQHFVSQDTGAGTRVVAMPKFGGGPAQVVPGSQATKTATIADQLAREKFNWEKANPGFELKETEDGNIVGVNKRTLQAFPVTVGGAEGATSVSTPLKGKATALTESQGNATAYGMRMLESNKLLNDLEKSGTVSSGRIKGAVENTLKLTPFVGENLAEAGGAVMNVLPGVLGGPNAKQQEYDQAKRNFISAVLRKESGASISQAEFANEEKKYFPQPGESESTTKQKQRARELAIEAMIIQAGPGAKNIGAGGGASANDPLGLLPKPGM